VNCSRQFIVQYAPPKGYSDEFKRECLKMYANGIGFRAMERVKGVHHTTSSMGLNKLANGFQILMNLKQFLRWGNWMSWPLLSAQKKQTLAVDSCPLNN